MFEHRRRRWPLIALLLGFVALFALGSPASAQDDEVGIFGNVDYEDPESGEDVPVEGVEIDVTGPNGFTNTGLSDAAGDFFIAVPGNGDYLVELYEASLPRRWFANAVGFAHGLLVLVDLAFLHDEVDVEQFLERIDDHDDTHRIYAAL